MVSFSTAGPLVGEGVWLATLVLKCEQEAASDEADECDTCDNDDR